MLEDKPDKNKIGWYGNSQYCQWSKFPTQSNPEEEIEKYNVQKIVHEMCTSKPNAILCRSLFLKGKMGRKIVVHEKAEDISNGIGYIDINPMLQYPIDNIVYGCCCRSNNTEP